MKTGLNIAIIIAAYVTIVVTVYYSLLVIGVEAVKSLVESLVITTTIITLLVLWLFGRMWKEKENRVFPT